MSIAKGTMLCIKTKRFSMLINEPGCEKTGLRGF